MPTVANLRDYLMQLSRPTVCTLYTETEPAMVKKHRVTKEPNPYLGLVHKRATVNGMIGTWNYSRSVNRQRVLEEKEPDFVAFPRKWGNRLTGTALVEHNEQYYVEIKIERVLSVEYTILGQVASEEDTRAIKQYLSDQSDDRQGLDDPITIRDYKLSSVKAIRVGGELYEIG